MRVPLKAAVAVPIAAVAAAGLVAFSAGPASAASHGSRVAQKFVGGCAVDLSISHPKAGSAWAYAYVGPYSTGWTCQGYVKNTHGTKSWTPGGNGGWSGGVWDGKGYKAWSCVYAYDHGKFKTSGCTSSH
jgi:hypothetical protein